MVPATVNKTKLPKSVQLHSVINFYHTNAFYRHGAYSSPSAYSGKYGIPPYLPLIMKLPV